MTTLDNKALADRINAHRNEYPDRLAAEWWVEAADELLRLAHDTLTREPSTPSARPPKPAECREACPPHQVCDHCQWPPATSDATPSAQAGEVERFDAAAAAEIERVSTLEYNAKEMCRYFALRVRERLATPQPQGYASGQVSGGGEVEREIRNALRELYSVTADTTEQSDGIGCAENALNRALAALSAPQARPDGGAVWVRADALSAVADHDVLTHLHATQAAGLVPLYTHPAPAPDVARLVEAAQKAYGRFMAINADEDGDSYLNESADGMDELREALAPFIAAQQESQ